MLARWAFPACLVPLSYRLHAELAAEHGGAERWGYRGLGCGSFAAKVTRLHLSEIGTKTENGEPWRKLPKQNATAKKMLRGQPLPADLDWVERDLISSWEVMGNPGETETAQVHPYHFTTSIAEFARGAGVDIRTKTKVTNISTAADGSKTVEYLDRENSETKQLAELTDVVVAAGPWTGRVLPRSKIEGLRAHSVVYEADVSPYAVFTDIDLPSDFVPEHRLNMGQKRKHKGNVDPEIYARPFGEVYACGKFQSETRAGLAYTKQSAGEPDTALALPETADEVKIDEAQCDDIIAYIKTISSVLGAAPIKTKQACYLPRHMRFGDEAGPLIGETSVPRVWVAAGHSCWGIQNGPATGKLMSELLFDGVASSADIDNLRPISFKV